MRFPTNSHLHFDDYWMGLRLKQMDVPALHLLIDNEADAKHDSPTLLEAAGLSQYSEETQISPTCCHYPYTDNDKDMCPFHYQ